MGTFRMARINKQLQREISLLLEQRVKNDSVRNAIITGVDCSKDLERAKVYFTSLDSKGRDALLNELQSVKGALRSMLGQVLTLRHIPALEFVIDNSLDYGERIDGILHRLGLNSVSTENAETEDDYGEDIEGDEDARDIENGTGFIDPGDSASGRGAFLDVIHAPEN